MSEYNEYILKSDAGFDIIKVSTDGTNSIQVESHSMPWKKELFLRPSVLIEENDLCSILVNGQILETSTFIYSNVDGSLMKASKEEILSPAVEKIVQIMEQLQVIKGFLYMTPEQKDYAKKYVLSSLSLTKEANKEFRFPVFAYYNYMNSGSGDKVLSYLRIITETQTWKDVMDSIIKPDWML